MAPKSPQYKLLKKYKEDVMKAVTVDLNWFADELNKDDISVLTDPVYQDITNTQSSKTQDDKVRLVVEKLLERVDQDPSVLSKFVEILKEDPDKYSNLIEKLDQGSGSSAATPPVASGATEAVGGELIFFGRKNPKLEDIFLVKNKSSGEKFKLWEKIVAKWPNIGTTLGIESGILDAIRDEHGDAESKLRKVLGMWFDNASSLPNNDEYPLTWRGLKTLLEDIEKHEVASDFFKFLEDMK